MEYRQLGNSGVRVSVIGLGTNQFGSDRVPQQEVSNIVDVALDLGVNLIDTADIIYQGGRSEETLGVALKGRWHQVILATKFYFPVGDGPNEQGASRYHMMNAVEASLRRLQSDHIDLYYVHWWDENTPIEETLRALDDLIRMGKVRYVGASNFAAWQLAHANLLAEVRGWTPFVVVQNHYNMLTREAEREVLPYCAAHGVSFVPYYPLAGGVLTGKYRQGEPMPPGCRGEFDEYVQECLNPANYSKVERLVPWAEERGHSMNELALAWLLAHGPVCSAIAGATRAEHVRSNVNAAEWKLTADELGEVNAILD
jgi:aryl-alcohol dehydrogenase-like predicted oxidoreductase